jgi:hypothetical protein
LLEYPHKFLRGLPEVVSVVEDSRAVLEVQVEDAEVSFIGTKKRLRDSVTRSGRGSCD